MHTQRALAALSGVRCTRSTWLCLHIPQTCKPARATRTGSDPPCSAHAPSTPSPPREMWLAGKTPLVPRALPVTQALVWPLPQTITPLFSLTAPQQEAPACCLPPGTMHIRSLQPRPPSLATEEPPRNKQDAHQDCSGPSHRTQSPGDKSNDLQPPRPRPSFASPTSLISKHSQQGAGQEAIGCSFPLVHKSVKASGENAGHAQLQEGTLLHLTMQVALSPHQPLSCMHSVRTEALT